MRTNKSVSQLTFLKLEPAQSAFWVNLPHQIVVGTVSVMTYGAEVILPQSTLFVSTWSIRMLLWTVCTMTHRHSQLFGSNWSIRLLLRTVKSLAVEVPSKSSRCLYQMHLVCIYRCEARCSFQCRPLCTLPCPVQRVTIT